MKGKVLLGLILGVVLVSMIASLASARMYVRQEPPGRTATLYIANIISLAGGETTWGVTREGSKYLYRIVDIDAPVPGFSLDLGVLNNLINEVISNPKLRGEDTIREFIEYGNKEKGIKGLYELYPGLEDAVNAELENIIGGGTRLRNTIASLLPDGKVDIEDDLDVGFLNAHINKLKKGATATGLIDEIELFKIPLKGIVTAYIKSYSGEDFDIRDGFHSGVLSFFSEWANSLDLLAKTDDLDGAIDLVSNYITTLTDIRGAVQEQIYKGADIGIFNNLESGIPGYLASLKLVNPDVDLNAKIAEIGSKMQELRDLSALKEALNSYAGGTVSEDMVSRFAAMMLGKSLSAWEDKLLFDWSQGVSDRESSAVLFDSDRLADKLEIVNKARANLSIDQIFDLNRDIITDSPDKTHINLQEWMVRLIDDMSYVKGEFEDKFGAGSIDINNPVHEAVLVDYASRIADLVDFDEQGHNVARDVIAKEISNMKEEDFKDLFSAELDLSSTYAVEYPVFDDNIGGESPVFGVVSDPLGNIF